MINVFYMKKYYILELISFWMEFLVFKFALKYFDEV